MLSAPALLTLMSSYSRGCKKAASPGFTIRAHLITGRRGIRITDKTLFHSPKSLLLPSAEENVYSSPDISIVPMFSFPSTSIEVLTLRIILLYTGSRIIRATAMNMMTLWIRTVVRARAIYFVFSLIRTDPSEAALAYAALIPLI